MKDAFTKRRRRVAIAALGVIALMVPTIAAAQVVFPDVPPGYVHEPAINWAFEHGITVGCEDGTIYCPTDPTTRAQMATFLHRMSGNAPGVAPTVNAATLDGHEASDFLGVDDTAADSDQLGGRPAEDYVTTDDLPTLLDASVTLRQNTESWLIGITETTTVSCLEGEIPVGGGYESAGLLTLNVTANRPTPTGWQVTGTASLLADVTVFVSCLSIDPPA